MKLVKNRTFITSSKVLSGTLLLMAVLSPQVAQATTNVSTTETFAGSANPANNLNTGDTFTVRTTAPVVTTGANVVTMEQDYSALAPVGHTTVNGVVVPDVTAPEGYTLSYKVNGTWSGTVPTYNSTSHTFPGLTAIKSSGTTTITSYSNNIEHITRNVSATPLASNGFSGSSGGDGWDVFFGTGTAADKVFNIYHHSNPGFGLDCHNKSDGSSCWGGAKNESGSYYTPAHATGFYVAATDSVWAFIGTGSSLGMKCITNVSTATPIDCATPYVSLETTSQSGYTEAGDSVRIGNRVFARGVDSGQNMLCFNLDTAAPCASQPYSIGSPTTARSANFNDNRLLLVGTQVFFNTGTILGCFDSTTNALCSTFHGGTNLTTAASGGLFYTTPTNSSTPNQVCAYSSMATTNNNPVASTGCYTLTGGAGTSPAMRYYTSAITDGWGAMTNIGQRLFYFTGDTVVCFDFVTNANCSNFVGSTMGSYAYTIIADPVHPACIWSNSNAGVITTFSANSGLSPCVANVGIVGTAGVLPRLSCSESGRVTAWDRLVLTPPSGQALSGARITVLNSSGAPISGWSDLSLTDTTTGTLDLSSLTIAQTGTQPEFDAYYVGYPSVTGTSMTFMYAAAAPQMCVNITVVTACPTGAGTDNTPASLGYLYQSLVSYTDPQSNVSNETTTANASANMNLSSCLGSSTGVVTIGSLSGPVSPGTTVYLYGSDGLTILATTVTDSNGAFSFPNLFPNTYQASLSQAGATGILNGTSSNQQVIVCPLQSTCFETSTLLAPAVIPDPVQLSSITSCINTSGPLAGGNRVIIAGNFVSPISAIDVGGTRLTSAQWSASSSAVSILMPAHNAGSVGIQLYNGQAPLMSPCAYTYAAAVPTPTPTPTPVVTPTPTPVVTPTPAAGGTSGSGSNTSGTSTNGGTGGTSGSPAVAGAIRTTAGTKQVVVNQIVPVQQTINVNEFAAQNYQASGPVTVNAVTVNNKPIPYTLNADGSVVLKTLVGPKDKVAVSMVVDNKPQIAIVQDANDKIDLANVNFDTASYVLTPAAKAILDHVAQVVLQHGFTSVDLVGFTDTQGVSTNYDNQTLSHDRAVKTRAYLRSKFGAQDIKVTIDALAYMNPVASNSSTTGQAANRRVEIVVH